MRKLMMAGALAAAALLARDVQAADEAAKERREAYDATKADVQKEAREAKEEVKQESREAKEEVKQESREAKGEMHQRTARNDEKKHPIFEGKDNFEVKGKIQKVSMNSITVAREELPAATLNVSKGTKIELDGEQASMKQLKAGQEVKASFNLQGAKPEAVEIKAEKMK